MGEAGEADVDVAGGAGGARGAAALLSSGAPAHAGGQRETERCVCVLCILYLSTLPGTWGWESTATQQRPLLAHAEREVSRLPNRYYLLVEATWLGSQKL